MSDRLPYPRSPTSAPDGLQQSVHDVVRLLHQLFFPSRPGELGLLQRVEKLERASSATTTVGVDDPTTQRVWVDDGTSEEPGVLIIDEGVGI